jgi:two-component system sensor histidine kinase UhpB
VPLELGLANAVESLVASWQLRNPEVTFNVDVTEESCGAKLNNVVHGIVRESLSNALKHGKPAQIDVKVEQTDGGDVLVTVRDDGGGLAPSSLSSGFGLIAMKERVAALGGSVKVQNRAETHGVEVLARLPLREPHSIAGVAEDVEAVKA